MSRSRSKKSAAARTRKARERRQGPKPQLTPTPPPVALALTPSSDCIPIPPIAVDPPLDPVRIDAAVDPVDCRAVASVVDEPEPASLRAVANEAIDAAPPSREPASEVTHLPWPIESLERFNGSRWRFVATLSIFTLLGLLVRDRGEIVRKWVTTMKRAAAAPLVTAQPAADEAQGPCPREMSLVERDDPQGKHVRVCVDRWEASLVEITADGEERPWSPYLPVDGHVVKAVSSPGVVPQGYINRDEAQAACESAGKRLCHVEEWVAACQGPAKTKYPYGDTVDEAACNTHGKSPLGELFGTSFGGQLWDSRVMNDPSLNALDGTVAKTGTFNRCVNGYGLHDMVGNLHEWTAESNGVFRGGYYQDATKNGDGCAYKTSAHAPTYHDYSTGFRCCRDAE